MKIIKLDNSNINEIVQNALKVLNEGGIVLYPTDTIYGLGVDAHNSQALSKLKELKARDASKPISILVSDLSMLEKYGVPNHAAKLLIKKFLPGALTMILKATRLVPKELNNTGEIGVRISPELICLEIMKLSKTPITTTSANISGYHTEENIESILKQFGENAEKISLVIDGGPRGRNASTIVSCLNEIPVVLREGTIRSEDILKLIDNKI